MNNKIRLQPLFTMDRTDIFGYEALYRKEQSPVYPSAVSILRDVLFTNDDKNDWNFKYFINMTNDDAINHGFVVQLLKLLEKIDIDPNRVVLELNEATDPSNLEQARKNLSILRSHGVQIALDDFGTYFSTLEFMSKLPLDIVKIDKQFVQKAPLSRRDMSLLKFSVEVSHDIGCLVVAEGIETKEQLDCSMDAGADIGQGFIFSVPTVSPNGCINTPFISLADFSEYLAVSPSEQVVAA